MLWLPQQYSGRSVWILRNAGQCARQWVLRDLPSCSRHDAYGCLYVSSCRFLTYLYSPFVQDVVWLYRDPCLVLLGNYVCDQEGNTVNLLPVAILTTLQRQETERFRQIDAKRGGGGFV